MSAWLQKLLLAANLLAIAGLLLAYAAPHISPADFWPISYFGLLYIWLVLLNGAFILLWLLLRKYLCLLSLIALLAGWSYLNKTIRFPSLGGNTSENEILLTVMSYNVRNFDYYNWTHNTKTQSLMIKLITEEAPDIVCFQEFFTSTEEGYRNITTLQQQTRLTHHYFNRKLKVRGVEQFGIAIFSRFPIIAQGTVFDEPRSMNSCIYADIALPPEQGGDTIRVYNLHLQSVRFIQEDYRYFEELTLDIQQSRRILSMLKQGYIKRVRQTELVREHIRQSPYRVIVCGDFNDTPVSYTYHRISRARNLKDAFSTKGDMGFGSTYAGPLPFLRIDYILTEPHIQVKEFYTIRKEYSDHYPIIARLQARHP